MWPTKGYHVAFHIEFCSWGHYPETQIAIDRQIFILLLITEPGM